VQQFLSDIASRAVLCDCCVSHTTRLRYTAFHCFSTISAAARLARRGASDPPCWTKMSTVSVINWWSRPSPVYHNDGPPKLTAPETISRSRDMVGDHQNLHGLRDLTTLYSGVCHSWASTCYRQPSYQIWSLHLYSLLRYERRYKMLKMGWFREVRVTQDHWK